MKSNIPYINVPDNQDYCNVAAEKKDNKLFIHILVATEYRMQIEIGEIMIHRYVGSYFNNDREFNEYNGRIGGLYWLVEGRKVRYLNDAADIIESFTGVCPTKYEFPIFIKILNKKYFDGDKAYQAFIRNEEERVRIFSAMPDEPDDIVSYATNGPLGYSAYIVVTQNLLRKSKRDFYCTRCNHIFTGNPRKQGTFITCPKCEKASEVKYARYFHRLDESNFTAWQLAKDGKGIFARYYLCRRDYSKSYRNVKTELCELGRYYFAPGISRLWTRTEHCQSTQNQWFTDSESWYKRGMFFFSCSHFYNGLTECIETVMKVFPHCQWRAYRDRHLSGVVYFSDIGIFLHKYIASPQLEYFIKLKLDGFVKERVYGSAYKSAVNWRGKKPESIFGLPISIIKSYIFEHKIDDSCALAFAKLIYKQGNFSDDNLELMRTLRNDLGNYSWMDFMNEFGKGDIVRVMKYLIYQQCKEERYTKTKTSLYHLLYDYKDYLRMAAQVGYNLESDYFRYPKYLKKAHDDVQKLIKVQKNKQLEDNIKKQVKKLSKYRYELNGLIIRPALSAKEIEQEGKVQNICIASYIERYSKGETSLLFIRRKSAPNKPFYAVELNAGEIRQVRGRNNEQATPEVQVFIDAFKAEKLTKKKRAQKQVVETRIRVAV